ncbi:uncharacterized protein PV07_08754 [Cladophialophora immunda]|uniref:Uncharacterized protein n=1 Tax=Cladophialophora immunda TaxID=569365 RepID=A0A0D2C317_9EURO|nr:uncharacterized protein PV07_08754 [Cladophialophora immunda]KIW25588.1 hypothetical protein PV07_08754 [Cladophialophora immunda]OQV07695.1 hypothetical protein CLAIMM_12095 [Cladophialophora immunda]
MPRSCSRCSVRDQAPPPHHLVDEGPVLGVEVERQASPGRKGKSSLTQTTSPSSTMLVVVTSFVYMITSRGSRVSVLDFESVSASRCLATREPERPKVMDTGEICLTTYLYLYPIFHGCVFPSRDTSHVSGYSEVFTMPVACINRDLSMKMIMNRLSNADTIKWTEAERYIISSWIDDVIKLDEEGPWTMNISFRMGRGHERIIVCANIKIDKPTRALPNTDADHPKSVAKLIPVPASEIWQLRLAAAALGLGSGGGL